MLLVTFFLYAPVRGYDFVNYDDPDYVTANPMVQGGVTQAGLHWAFTQSYAFNWHPLTWISHMLDCQWFGLDAGRHHLTSLAFHVANTGLLFWLVWLWTGAYWRSALVAAVFAWHPFHVESVAWVCERKDVLSAFFGLLTLLAYTAYARRFRARGFKAAAFGWYALALLLLAAGLMSKPMLVTWPCLLLLLDFWPLQRREPGQGKVPGWGQLVAEKIPFFVLVVTSAIVTFQVQQAEGAVATTSNFTVSERVANAFVAYARYFGKSFWPQDLVVFYMYPDRWKTGVIAGAVVLFVALSAVACWQARRRPWLFVGWFWFVGTLVPVIGLVQVGLQSMADRYTYLPMIGLSLAVIFELQTWTKRFLPAAASGAIAALVLGAGLWTAHAQVKHWQNSETLFRHAVQVEPRNTVAQTMLGNTYDLQGRAQEALVCYQAVVVANPQFVQGYFNLGNGHARLNQLAEAAQAYEQALHMQPDYVDAMGNLGIMYERLGRPAEAEQQYVNGLKYRPDDPDLARNYAVYLLNVRRAAEAYELLRKATTVRATDPVLFLLLGDAARGMQQPAQAAEHYRQALALQPDFAEAQKKLAAVTAATPGGKAP